MDQGPISYKWNNFRDNLSKAVSDLLKSNYIEPNITLSVENGSVRAHQLVLASCSPYFRDLIKTILPSQHPVVFIKDVKLETINLLLQFMYNGVVSVPDRLFVQFKSLGSSFKVAGIYEDVENVVLDICFPDDEFCESSRNEFCIQEWTPGASKKNLFSPELSTINEVSTIIGSDISDFAQSSMEFNDDTLVLDLGKPTNLDAIVTKRTRISSDSENNAPVQENRLERTPRSKKKSVSATPEPFQMMCHRCGCMIDVKAMNKHLKTVHGIVQSRRHSASASVAPKFDYDVNFFSSLGANYRMISDENLSPPTIKCRKDSNSFLNV